MSRSKLNKNIYVSISITIVTAMLFTFLFLYLGINHRREVYNDSKILAAEISRKASFETEVYLNSAINYAKSLEKQIQLLRRLNGSREEIKFLLRQSIESNNNYLGAWTLWEPNAFDGKDYLYERDTLYNEKGSIGIGYFRYKDSINYEIMTLADYEGDYFMFPKQSKKIHVTDPYKFVYSGFKEVFFGTTISIPILDEDKFLGTIGIDIDLGDLQSKLNQIHPYKNGYLSLISNNGKIITHIDKEFINKDIFNLLTNTDTLSYKAITQGKELTFEIKSEFTGKKAFRLFYPIFISDNEPWSMMIEIPWEDTVGRTKLLLFVAILTLVVGLLLLLYLIVNINLHIKHEKELMAAKDKAEQSDRLKTAFLNNVSHEIRTPLNGIVGFSELLIDSNEDEQTLLRYKNIVRKSCDHLLSVVSDVIDLSKIQTEEEKVNLNIHKIGDVLLNIKEIFEPLAKEKHLEFRLNLPPENKEYLIETDNDKFRRIFTYMLNNAFKFTDKGFVEFGYIPKGKDYLFYVKDSGVGIKPEHKEHIFKFFNQGINSSIRPYDGLGIGLSLTKAFVDMLGGTIYFESELNTGTTFYFTLPGK